MDATPSTAATEPTPWTRAAPLTAAAALAAGAVYVASNDPARPGATFLPCVFHRATGWWCPGCGLTRGTHALLHGDVAAAVSINVFTPFVATAVLVLWLGWLRRAWGVRLAWTPRPRPRGLDASLIAGVVAYGVLRNLPGLEALAP